MKYIEAKTIQDKNTGMTHKTRMQSFAQFVYRRYNKTPVSMEGGGTTEGAC